MLISTHIPKTAGTSFLRALREEFNGEIFHDTSGNNLPFLRDFLTRYDYKPSYKMKGRFFDRSRGLCLLYERFRLRYELQFIKRHYRVIHGHFPVEKYYRLFPDAQLVIFFRDPVEQLISHYQHIKRRPKPQENITGEESLNYLINYQNYSLADFSSIPRVINFYRRYIYPRSIKDFSFVGLVEEYDLSITLFNKMFGSDLKILKGNINPERKTISDLCTNVETVKVLENIKEKQKIYDKAKRKFYSLCKIYL